jgi:hypothetical protein
MSGPALQVAVLPSVTINYVTYTAKRANAPITISYTNGATAGAEVVSVSGFNITVQIEEGASTNAQIKAAILASKTQLNGNDANDLVSIAITAGHTTDTNTTFNQAALRGGAADTKASYQLPNFLIQATAAGTAPGNSITFHLTAGAVAGSEVVSVSTDAITVQIADGVSTVQQLATAVAASGPAAALIKILNQSSPTGGNAGTLATTYGPGVVLSSNPYVSDSNRVFVAEAPVASPVALAGGVDAAPASLTLQGLTVTSITNDPTQNGLTVSLSTGGTAGSEVVTVDALGNVNVQIEAGVSTDSQIRDALNAVTAFTDLYTASCVSSGFALVAASAITNVGSSVINGDVDVYPGTSVTGFPPGIVNGAINIANTAAQNAIGAAQATFTANQASALGSSTVIASDLGGQTLTPGNYTFASGAATLAGSGPATLTFNGAGTYIIYTASTLDVGAGGAATVALTNGATAANIFWTVNSSATLQDAGTVFNGNVFCTSDCTFSTGGTYNGQMAALTGTMALAGTGQDINGAAGIVPNTVNDQVMSGEVAASIPPDNINESNDGNSYFCNSATTATTTSFVAFPFGFFSREIQIFGDDASKTLSYSFDGTTVAGTLLVSSSLKLDCQEPGIWLKSSSAGATYRLIAL